MLTTVVWVWAAGLVLMLLGFLFKSSDGEKKRVSPIKMALAYILWPITLLAAILQVLSSSLRR